MSETARLRFLADESCDFAVVRALRAAGFDVLAVAEFSSRTVDAHWIDQAFREERILLTEDKDFGWLVFIARTQSPGVILVRFPGNARSNLGPAVVQLIDQHANDLRGSFAVLTPGLTRITSRPG